VVILEEERAVLADTLSLVRVGHGNAIGGCIDGILGFGIPIIEIVAVNITGAAAIGAVVSRINC
jgi:hypothetical protein